MRIAIIGAGNVGGTLGRAWAGHGHKVFYGVREPEAPEVVRLTAATPGAKAGDNRAAGRHGEVIVLSVPFDSAEAAIAELGDLTGKILLDCTNPLSADFRELTIGFSESGAERIAAKARGASLFKTLNQTGFGNMANPAFPGGRAVMFVAGDDQAQKPVVLRLIGELGFDAVDAGGLKVARLLEPFGMLWIHLANAQRLGRDIGFALLRR